MLELQYAKLMQVIQKNCDCSGSRLPCKDRLTVETLKQRIKSRITFFTDQNAEVTRERVFGELNGFFNPDGGRRKFDYR